MAMVNQYMLAQSDVGPQGNANYVLYPLASQQINAGTQCASAAVTSGNACTFYDITEGNNSVPCTAGSPNCSASTFGTIGVLVDGDGNIAWSVGTGYDLQRGWAASTSLIWCETGPPPLVLSSPRQRRYSSVRARLKCASPVAPPGTL